MNETQRARILLLVMAGILLIGGSLLWVNTHRQTDEDVIFHQSFDATSTRSQRLLLSRQSRNASRTKAFLKETSLSPLDLAHLPPRTQLTRLSASMPSGKQKSINPEVASTGEQAPVSTQASPSSSSPSSPPTLATTLSQAQEAAKQGSGRVNPFLAITGWKPFPSSEGYESLLKSPDEGQTQETKARTSEHKKTSSYNLVPPPPPVQTTQPAGTSEQVQLPIDELPPPPAKPQIADKMKLIAVVGDRALFEFTDSMAQAENKWPKTVSLALGEKFSSVSLVAITGDSATLDEDGQRFLKELGPIR